MAVVASFSMSLDGFVADLDDRVGPLFDWLFNGTVEVTQPGYPITYRMSPASARYWARSTEDLAAMVFGRRAFDRTGGRSPVRGRVFVVTHRPPPDPAPPVTFVTSGVADAVAQARTLGSVGVVGPSIAQQCLNLGLLDEVRIDLVPVLLGKGIRYFGDTAASLHRLEVVDGDGVTHLRYRVIHR